MFNIKDEQVEADFEKCKKVILSCNTKDQLKSDYNYYKLWHNNNRYFLDLVEIPTLIYWDGILTGCLQGKLNIYDK